MTHTELDYAARIRAGGHRLTPQRQIILDTLCDLGGHVPVTVLVDAVQRVTPAIDRATVYRTVSFFSDLGLVVSSEADGVNVVEIMVTGESGHCHLICTICGHIGHVPAAVFDELAHALLVDYGFAADLTRLTLEGTCAQCKMPSAVP